MARPNIPAAGEIRWLDIQPFAGKEQRGRHAGLILSAFKFNMATGFAFIAPITTAASASRANGFAWQLTGAGASVAAIIQIDQMKSMDWRNRNAEKSQDKAPDGVLAEVLQRFAAIFGLVFAAPDQEQQPCLTAINALWLRLRARLNQRPGLADGSLALWHLLHNARNSGDAPAACQLPLPCGEGLHSPQNLPCKIISSPPQNHALS